MLTTIPKRQSNALFTFLIWSYYLVTIGFITHVQYYLHGALLLDETVLTAQGMITKGENNANQSVTYHQ